MVYLIDHPPAVRQYRSPRRESASGVCVLHTAENAPDFVAFDGGAEAVAAWMTRRTDPGSYHDLVDSDSAIQLVDYGDEAFHDGTGTNPHSYGLSIATRADVWPLAPQVWRDGAIEQAAHRAARFAGWLGARRGLVIPAKRITVLEARNRVPGWVTHAELDPTRRTDPGEGFPFDQFLTRFAQLTGQEDDIVASIEEMREVMLDVVRKEGISEGVAESRRMLGLLLARAPGDIDIDELATQLRIGLGEEIARTLGRKLTATPEGG